MERILLIDDDTELCELLLKYMSREGFDITAVNDGKSGLERALSDEYALIVLDVMLPLMNGFEVLKGIRLQSDMPVLMLTARGEDVDRIVGLEMGADDYLAKPFNPRELLARVRAVLRRVRPGGDTVSVSQASERIVVGNLVLDVGRRMVHLQGKPVDLTSVEFSLLEVLLRAAGRTVTREELAEGAMGRGLGNYDRSIDVHISSLRKKLGRHVDDVERIKTVRGTGYQYTLPSEPSGAQSDI